MRPFSMRDKLGYTLGDLGCCCTEQFRAMYLSVFYTLILQVNPFHIGILMLITKIWDAVNDPIIGAIVDSRKATKGGKFIPWIRAFSFPMAVLCILGFVNVSNLAYGLRLAYMFVTYVLYEALYTCVNVPFGTLSSVMTDDVRHRTALSRYRSLGGTIFMTVIVMVGPLVLYVDNKPVAGRFLMLASVFALITFAITQPLADKLGKKEWCCWGAGFAAAVFALLFFFPIHNPVLFIVINGVCYLGASGMQVLIWAMVNDSIDYHELQTGERNEGIVYSTYSFFRKLASAVSGSLSSFVLGFIGYNVAEGAVQTAEVSNAIWKSYTGIYVLGYGVAVAILFFVYPLTMAKTTEMLEQLKARRAEKASAVETDGEQCP